MFPKQKLTSAVLITALFFSLFNNFLFSIPAYADDPTFTDDHGDGTLTGWTAATGPDYRTWIESGGVATVQNSNGPGFLTVNTTTTNDMEWSADLAVTVPDPASCYTVSGGGLIIRYLDPSNYYYVVACPAGWAGGQSMNNVLIFCVNTISHNNSPDSLPPGCTVVANNLNWAPYGSNFNLKVRGEGSDFTFYLNDAQVGGTHTDSTHASGKVGYAHPGGWNVLMSFDNAELTNLGGGNIAPPAPTGLTATPATDGSGNVQIQVSVDDEDNDELALSLRYKAGECSTYNGSQPPIELIGTPTATYDPENITLDNEDLDGYQLRGITNSAGANQVTTTWDSMSQVPSADGSYCIYAFSHDGTVNSLVTTTTVTLDNVAPEPPTFDEFLSQHITQTSIHLRWIAPMDDITGYTVQSTAADPVSTSNLSHTFADLSPNTQYSFEIRSIDDYGNIGEYSEPLLVTTRKSPDYTDNHDDGATTGWTKYGTRGWSEASGESQPQNNTSTSAFMIWDTEISSDFEWGADLITPGNPNSINGGLIFRFTDTSNFYYVYPNVINTTNNDAGNTLILCVNTTAYVEDDEPPYCTVVATGIYFQDQKFNLRVEAVIDEFKFYVNNILVGTYTDSTHEDGKVGYFHANSFNRYVSFDNAAIWLLGDSGNPDPLGPPGNIQSGTITSNSIQLTWDPVDDAAGYKIVSSVTTPQTTDQTTFTFNDLTPNTEYTFQVSTIDIYDQEGPLSLPVNFSTTYPPPLNPPGYIQVEADGTNIDVTWEELEGAVSYELEIEIQTGEDQWEEWEVQDEQTTTLLSYRYTDLIPDTQYRIRIWGIDQWDFAGDKSDWQYETTGLPASLPAPDNFTLTGKTNTTISFSWDEVEGASYYRIRWGGGNNYEDIEGESQTASIENLTPATGYLFTISTIDEYDQVGTPSATEITTSTFPNPFSAPGNFEVTDKTNTTVDLSWNTVAGAEKYRIEVEWGESNEVELFVDAPTTTANVINLIPETEYTFTITAIDELDGYEQEGAQATINETTLPNLLAAPQGFAVTGRTNTTISLEWDSLDGAEKYLIIWGVEEEEQKEVESPATSTVIDGLTPETEYTFEIVGIDEYEREGATSDPLITSTFPNPLSAPDNFTLTVKTNTTISLEWDEVQNAESYLVSWGIEEEEQQIVEHPTTETTISGLTPNTSYTFTISTIDEHDQVSTPSATEITTSTFPNPFSAPGNFEVTDKTNTTVDLSWNTVAGAEKYRIEVEWGESNEVELFVDAPTTTANVINLIPETEYTFTITAIDELDGYEQEGAQATINETTHPNPLAPPSNIATQTESTTIQLSWNAVQDAQEYEIQWTAGGNVITDSTVHLFENLDPDTEYSFRIRTIDQYDQSGVYSDWVSGTTLALEAPLPPPTGIIFSLVTDTALQLTWNPVDGAAEYKITSSSGTITTENTNHTFTSLTPNTQYTFQITSVAQSESEPSSPVARYTNAAKPLNLVPTENSQNSIKLQWNPNGNPVDTLYRVYNHNNILVATTVNNQATITGLTPASSYVFRVRAVHKQDGTTYTESNSSPTIITPAPVQQIGISLDTDENQEHQFQFIGGSGLHTAKLDTIDTTIPESPKAIITIQSNPITVTLGEGESAEIDTSGDNINDLIVTVNSINSQNGTVNISLQAVPQPISSSNPSKNGGTGLILSTLTSTSTTAPADLTETLPTTEEGIDHWVNQYIDELYKIGAIEHDFSPDQPITRAQLIRMIIIFKGGAIPYANHITFSDLEPDNYYNSYIEEARTRGYIEGYQDGTFRPNNNINRAEGLAMILKSFGIQGDNIISHQFIDTDDNVWYARFLNYAVEKGIVKGYIDGRFGPDDSLTQAQAIKIIVLSK